MAETMRPSDVRTGEGRAGLARPMRRIKSRSQPKCVIRPQIVKPHFLCRIREFVQDERLTHRIRSGSTPVPVAIPRGA